MERLTKDPGVLIGAIDAAAIVAVAAYASAQFKDVKREIKKTNEEAKKTTEFIRTFVDPKVFSGVNLHFQEVDTDLTQVRSRTDTLEQKVDHLQATLDAITKALEGANIHVEIPRHVSFQETAEPLRLPVRNVLKIPPAIEEEDDVLAVIRAVTT